MDAFVTPETVTTGERAAWVQAWAAVAALVIGVIVAGVAYSELSENERVRKMEKTDALWERFNSMEMMSARAEATKTYPKGSEPLLEIFSFFERLARAEELGIVKPDDLDYYFRDYMVDYWYAFNDWVKDQRRKNGEDPDNGELYRGYQRIISTLLKRQGVRPPTNADIQSFLAFEQKRFADAKAFRVEAILK
jgi:hypothetical protein